MSILGRALSLRRRNRSPTRRNRELQVTPLLPEQMPLISNNSMEDKPIHDETHTPSSPATNPVHPAILARFLACIIPVVRARQLPKNAVSTDGPAYHGKLYGKGIGFPILMKDIFEDWVLAASKKEREVTLDLKNGLNTRFNVKTIKPKINPTPRPRILLGVCGHMDAVNLANVCHAFTDWAELRVVATQSSTFYFDIESLRNIVPVYTDEDGLPPSDDLTVKLLRWSDLMVIAPLSAHTLAKIVGGLCDTMVTRIVRGWDFNKELFLMPRMVDPMWRNWVTEEHMVSLIKLGVHFVKCEMLDVPLQIFSFLSLQQR